MKTKLTIHRRLSHKYRTAYQHLDQWERLTEITQKAPAVEDWVESEDGYSWTSKVLVTMSLSQLAEAKRHHRSDTGMTFSQTLRSAIESLYEAGCSCEHDCCGHWFGYGDAVRVKPREWMVTIYRSANV